MKMLPLSFYLRPDVVALARALLGKVLVTEFGDGRTAGRIVETEAYNGRLDKASHAYKGPTKRTDVMFGEGGVAYVYLCYGIHHLFNIVTNAGGEPHAILIRGVEPLEGIPVMMERTGAAAAGPALGRGPGKVGRAFGFHATQCGLSLLGPEICLYDDGFRVPDDELGISPRIGVDYAGADAALPYRFYLKGHPSVSGKPR
ncbi:MAG: 3-methyladenine glycosylase [Flaviaesturariibacter sp.]|nr:3-methyladenine glycosylase [Flaviaesturariibacter sp.]